MKRIYIAEAIRPQRDAPYLKINNIIWRGLDKLSERNKYFDRLAIHINIAHDALLFLLHTKQCRISNSIIPKLYNTIIPHHFARYRTPIHFH